MAEKVASKQFVAELEKALNRRDGYIMGSKGQNPKKWAVNSWWYTQYSGKQKTQALKWREQCDRVWDCNGLSEGIYEDFTGVNINTKARYNYSGWCGEKGSGIIPAKYRVPGAAVFWGNNAASIHHVAYLYKPVVENNVSGDWYLIEARGVMYGVVKTKLLDRKPNYWGLMTKYFDYDTDLTDTADYTIGDRILKNGCEGDDVRQLQTNLIRLGYDCGKYGADGDFGDATEIAVRKFQQDHKLDVDGEYGPKTHAVMEDELSIVDKPVQEPKHVTIVGGQCWIRTAPTMDAEKIGVARESSVYPFGGEQSEDGWLLIEYCGKNAWVSGKYGVLMA